MKREYKVTKTTTSLIKYHFVFCPKYRRKIFLIHGVEERMKELTKEQCEKDQIEILEMKCDVPKLVYINNICATNRLNT